MVVDPKDKKIKIMENYKPEIKKRKKVLKIDPVTLVEREETESNPSDKLTLSIFAGDDLEAVNLNYRELRADKPAFEGSISDKEESDGSRGAKPRQKGDTSIKE